MDLIEIPQPSATDPLVSGAFDAVLRPSFSIDELPSIDTVTGADGDDGYRLLVVAVGREDGDGDGDALGAALYSEDGTGLGKLDYLAARPGIRSRGVGSALMGRLASVWPGRPVVAVLGEVHDPRFHAEGPDELPSARLRFYQRCGARLLDLPWVQPRLSPDGARVHHMLLVDLLPGIGQPLSSERVGRWVQGYYLAAEGAVPTDSTYEALLARVFSRDEIGLGSIDHPEVDPLVVNGGERWQ